MDNEFIRKNILKIRREKDLTQQEVADRMDITRSAYCKIEYGQTKMISDNLLKFAAATGTGVEEVILGYVPVEDRVGVLKDSRDRHNLQMKELKADYEARLEKLALENRSLKEMLAEKDRHIRTLESIVDYMSKSAEK